MKYRKLFSVLLVLSLGVVLTACEEQEPFAPQYDSPAADNLGAFQKPFAHMEGLSQVKVMSWNVYVGANVDIILAIEDPTQIPVLVATAYQELLSTNFPERAQTMADEIARERPHLIGLQEISLIELNGQVQFDYLEILMNELGARGLNYQIAGKVDNPDVTVPILLSDDPVTLGTVRLLDSDVVLARADVGISNVAEVNYQAALPVPSFGITIPRGYVAVTATIGQKSYRFVNTHLEPAPIPEILPVQLGQAQELIATFAQETLPVIIVGDFNSTAPTSLTPAGETYQLLADSGYVDIWPYNLQGNEGEGLTNPHDSDLRNETVNFFQRIDLIFVRTGGGPVGEHPVGPVQATVFGDEFSERTASGLWPSDHAAVIARLHIPENTALAFD